MKTLIAIIFLLYPTSIFSKDIKCPMYKYKNWSDISNLQLTEDYKKLSNSEKQYCEKIWEKRAEKRKERDKLAKLTFGLSNLPTPIAILIIIGILGILGGVFSIFSKNNKK